jgi:hypothetical protein
MATKGPMPKRSTQRLGHRTQAERERTQTVVVPKTRKLYGPALGIADPHPLARDWYEGLRRSGQAEFYEPSDWAQARVLTELLSVTLNQDKPSSVMVAAWMSGAAELLTTEGARRRMRMELERSKPVDADKQRASGTVVDLRRRLAGG